MEPRPIESITLENGLKLEILDHSRMVAQDRWQVTVIARIEIEVTDQWFNDRLAPPATCDQLRNKLGDTVQFVSQVERNFVDDREKNSVLQHIQDRLQANKKYYSHPDFAARFIIREFKKPVY